MAGIVMRAKKPGVCKEETCNKPIKEGDPIVYFPRFGAFGLTCHKNEKTARYYQKFLEKETAPPVEDPNQKAISFWKSQGKKVFRVSITAYVVAEDEQSAEANYWEGGEQYEEGSIFGEVKSFKEI